MPPCGRFSASTRRAPSSIAATADLLSAPRIVPAAFRITPSSSITGSIAAVGGTVRSEEHTSELQSRGHLVCRLLLEKKKKTEKQSKRTQTHRNSLTYSTEQDHHGRHRDNC